MAAPLAAPLQPAAGLVLQYEVRFSVNHTCGGAYLKLLSVPEGGLEDFKPRRLKGNTPFSIMFGPDRCGPDARVGNVGGWLCVNVHAHRCSHNAT